MQTALKTAVILWILTASSGAALARGEEEFGNRPLNDANYTEWPGIMPVVNHTSRVYRTWVNGNEFFYYRGDTAALNAVLRKFAEARTEIRQVVLRPGPGLTHAFDSKTKVEFGWNLHLLGGIAKHLTTREGGEKVWSPHPVLTIYVGPGIDLKSLSIPPNLTVVPLTDVKQSIREGLKSKDKTVRGWGAGELAALDSYDTQSRDTIASLLKDDDNWVRLNAAGAVAIFGRKARTVLPLLRSAMETGDAQLKQRAEQSIREIEQAEDRSAAEREHNAILERIRTYLTRRKS